MSTLEGWILFGLLALAYLSLGVHALRNPGPDYEDCGPDCPECNPKQKEEQ